MLLGSKWHVDQHKKKPCKGPMLVVLALLTIQATALQCSTAHSRLPAHILCVFFFQYTVALDRRLAALFVSDWQGKTGCSSHAGACFLWCSRKLQLVFSIRRSWCSPDGQYIHVLCTLRRK
jgi:hypothetical protein